jgi:hypothetical protein
MAKPKRLLASPPFQLGLGFLAGYLLATPGLVLGGPWFLGVAIIALAGLVYSHLRWRAGRLFALGAFVMSLVGAGVYAVGYYAR